MLPLSQSSQGKLFRQSLRALYRADEAQCLNGLIKHEALSLTQRKQVRQRAELLVSNMRLCVRGSSGVDALVNEFSLSSVEGIVLMCLAETLLRVPDKVTTDRLIRDKLLQGDWSEHLDSNHSLFVNASSWGLLLTGKVIELATAGKIKIYSKLLSAVWVNRSFEVRFDTRCN